MTQKDLANAIKAAETSGDIKVPLIIDSKEVAGATYGYTKKLLTSDFNLFRRA